MNLYLSIDRCKTIMEALTAKSWEDFCTKPENDDLEFSKETEDLIRALYGLYPDCVSYYTLHPAVDLILKEKK